MSFSSRNELSCLFPVIVFASHSQKFPLLRHLEIRSDGPDLLNCLVVAASQLHQNRHGKHAGAAESGAAVDEDALSRADLRGDGFSLVLENRYLKRYGDAEVVDRQADDFDIGHRVTACRAPL